LFTAPKPQGFQENFAFSDEFKEYHKFLSNVAENSQKYYLAGSIKEALLKAISERKVVSEE